MGIRDKPIAPGSPWQNGFAERLIGSIRRECVDHLVVLGEVHLRRILTKYAAYYNGLRRPIAKRHDTSVSSIADASRLAGVTGAIVGARTLKASGPLALCEAAVIRHRAQPGRLAKRRAKPAGLAEADRQSDIWCGLGDRKRRPGIDEHHVIE